MAIPSVTCGSDQSLSNAGLPHTVSLTASATESPTAWEWVMLSLPPGSSADSGTNGDFTNGVSTSQNPQFNTDVWGDYVLQARAQNGSGWSLPSEDQDAAQTIVSVDSENGNRVPGSLTWNASWGEKIQALLHTVEPKVYLTKFGKFDATTAPGVSNDNTEGYEVGSLWIDVTADKGYLCLDASTGAAVWFDITQTGGGGGGGGRDREERKTTSNASGTLTDFTLAATPATAANMIMGVNLVGFRNGQRLDPVTADPADSTEIRHVSGTTVRVMADGNSTTKWVFVFEGA